MLFLTADIMTNVEELPCDFGLYGEGGELEGDAFIALEDMVYALWGQCWFDYKHGISKVVITSIEGDYVYKFPFYGYYNDENAEEYNEETDCYELVREPDFYGFSGAYGTNNSDYCNAEIELLKEYNENYGRKFNKMFPFTDKIQIKGITCYKQERCICVNDTNREKTYQPSEKVSKINEYIMCFDEDWIGEIEYRYGTEYALDFLDFAYDNLEDMHFRNYGYSEIDGRPVVIDWAGYDN